MSFEIRGNLKKMCNFGSLLVRTKGHLPNKGLIYVKAKTLVVQNSNFVCWMYTSNIIIRISYI